MVTNDINLDIGKYIEEQYIFLKAENFNRFGESKNAVTVFNERYKEEKDRIKTDMLAKDIAANSKMASITSKLGEAKAAEELYNLVSKGNLLEQCLEDVAAKINATIPEVARNNIQDIVENAYNDYSKLLEAGRPDATKLQDFFKLIIAGLEQLQGSVSDNFLVELARVKENFLEKGKNNEPLSTINEGDLSNAEFLIRKYLYAAAKTLNTSKDEKVAAGAFRGTLSNIFNTTICERISQKLLSEAVVNGLEDIRKALLEHRFGGSKEITIKATIPESDNSNDISNLATGLGQAVAGQDSHKSKVDLAGPGPLKIIIQEGEQSVEIQMELNASAKQVLTTDKKGAKRRWNLKGGIHIVSSSLGQVLRRINSPEISYYSYNTLVHKDNGMTDGSKAYRSFRNFVTASFFVEWLIGTGEQLHSGGQMLGLKDTAQFFLINNKLYSMATVIRRICEKIVSNKGNPPISIEIRGKAVNKRVGGVNANADIIDAKQRSDALREALNTVAIGATLSQSVINRYVPL